MELWDVERRLESLRDAERTRRRRVWLARYRQWHRIRAESYPSVEGHLDALEKHESALIHLRATIRQLADACAWLMLRTDARVVAPLYADRTNHLPKGRGMATTMVVVAEINQHGGFLAIQNDLTRCLGDGDVTVVRHGRPWALPVTYELKAPGVDRPLEVGELVDVNFTVAQTGHPDQASLVKEVAVAIAANDGHVGRRSASLERQEAGMRIRAELLHEANRPKERLVEPDRHWGRIEEVMTASVRDAGFAIVTPEPDIVYAAVRRGGADDPAAPMKHMLTAVREVIPTGSRMITTLWFAESDAVSATSLPVALWPVDVRHRADLLAGTAIFSAMHSEDLWRNAFAAEGLMLMPNGENWVIQNEHAGVVIDALDVRGMVHGVGLGATSPRSIAQTIRERLRREGNVQSS